MSASLQQIQEQFGRCGYVADDELAMTLQLMQSLERPLLVEGEAGVGKTEIAKVLADITDSPLIRLQCYDGLDTNAAVYEWNYTRQLIAMKLQESSDTAGKFDVFSEEFLLERPLLQSIRQPRPAVLLVDEIDRADEAFEAYLLELLSEFQISIPELGTIRASSRPRVVLTSNGTRELSDALRRRCLYHYLDYPGREKELAIIEARLPGIGALLARQVVAFIQALRQMDLRKSPGVAETLDWCTALTTLDVDDLQRHADAVLNTRSCFLKNRGDVEDVDEPAVAELLQKIA